MHADAHRTIQKTYIHRFHGIHKHIYTYTLGVDAHKEHHKTVNFFANCSLKCNSNWKFCTQLAELAYTHSKWMCEWKWKRLCVIAQIMVYIYMCVCMLLLFSVYLKSLCIHVCMKPKAKASFTTFEISNIPI